MPYYYFFIIVEDFDQNIHEASIPTGYNPTITVEIALPQDNIVEGREVYVILLEVTEYQIGRGCTAVRIPELFKGEGK